MPHMSGLEFLEKVKKLLPRTEIAVMTGHGSVETAVQAMKLGAYDYIAKPFSPLEELRLFLRRMAEKVRLVEENQFLRDRMDTETAAARHRRLVRENSGRAAHGLAPERHAHAGADHGRKRHRKRTGRPRHPLPRIIRQPSLRRRRLRLAGPHADRKRTVRLRKRRLHRSPEGRELACSSPPTAAPSSSTKSANCRSRCRPSCCASCRRKKSAPSAAIRRTKSMCASSPPPTAISKRNTAPGTFRKDLYFRLNVVTVHVPPLRERRSDIPMLAHWFLERCVPGRSVQVTNAAMKSLLQYDWPGNVRELENCVERAVALGNQQTLDVDDLPPAIASTSQTQERDAADSGPEPLHHRPRGHRAHHHRTRLRTSKRRQSARRKNARHQPCHALPQTEALQHRRPSARQSQAMLFSRNEVRTMERRDRKPETRRDSANRVRRCWF